MIVNRPQAGLQRTKFRLSIRNSPFDPSAVFSVSNTNRSDEIEATNPYNNPEKREWFEEQVKEHDLDPATTTLFDWLEVDDKASYQKAA